MTPTNQPNTLFTSAGRRIELLRAFKRAYDDAGLAGHIVAADIDPLAPALQAADRPYIVPRVTEPTYIPTLADICRREQIHLIFPLIDPDIPILDQNRRELEDAGARAVVVPEASAATTADKWQTYQFLHRLGVPTPRSWRPEDVPTADLTYPAFIKPRFGSAMSLGAPQSIR